MTLDTKKVIYSLSYSLFFLAVLWSVKLLEIVTDFDLYTYGNYPLSLRNSFGIVTQPLIHEGVMHLWSNSLPLLFMVWALFYFYGDISFKVFFFIWLASGLFTWFVGRPSYHIGASGMIYGFAFFLFFSGLLRRMRTLMALSAIVAFLYGGLVWNMLPFVEYWEPSLSWEGHLSGAFSGVVGAFLYRNHPPQPILTEDILEEEPDSDTYWLENNEEEQQK